LIARRWKSFDFEKKKNITQTRQTRRRKKTKSAGICGGSLE
jgi:hypothetical protein